METYLTTKQVQDLFKIDRITVYRMLQDGRLKGVKIGNQWRFPQREVDRLLTGETEVIEIEPESETIFPIHCVQTIQDLFTSVSQCTALTVDNQGEMVTEISQPGPFCQLLLSTEKGKEICKASWKAMAEQIKTRSEVFTSYAGLKFFGSVIVSQNKKQGAFLSGEFYFAEDDVITMEEQIREIAKNCDLPEQELIDAAKKVRRLTKQEQEHLSLQPAAAANAVESILNERGSFMQRLQQIANLTQRL